MTLSDTDTKRYVLVVTLYTKNNRQSQQQLKSGFKRIIINWKKYQSKVSREKQNQYLDYLNDPSFQEANRLYFYHWKIMIEMHTQDMCFSKIAKL